MSSGIKTTYCKNLVKTLKNTKSENLILVMKREMIYLMDQVDELLNSAKIGSESEAKKLINEQIVKLPSKEVFNIIRDLAIKYNPVLSNLIISKSDFSLQSVFG